MDSSKPAAKPKPKDFLAHLETYLAKRDGVDKLLKISRYAAKVILASSVLDHQDPPSPIAARLRSFESCVGVSRKAFRLGKFVQDVNSLRSTAAHPRLNLALSLVAHGGEGLYFFAEQFVWLGKAGLLDKRRLPWIQKLSAWCEFVGYFGSVSLKMIELRRIEEEEMCLVSSIDLAVVRGIWCGEEHDRLKRLREKKMLRRLSVVQDIADWMMALADIRDGRGPLSSPLFVSLAGLLSAVISTHKNWVSC